MINEDLLIYKPQLLKSPLFQGVNSDDLLIMLSCIKPKISKYKKNECLAIAGSEFNGMGLILSGKVSIVKENITGDRVIITILSSGEIFGEMVAFSEVQVWPATVIAEENSSVMFITTDKIVGNCEKQCNSHRQLIMNMLQIVSNKALNLNRKVEYLAIRSLRGKIATFLLEQYQITGQTMFMLAMSRNQLADFLNVSRPSLSREMGRMRDEGLIDFHRSSIHLKSLEKIAVLVSAARIRR